MGFRCELCDDWLPLMSFSKLCPTCYKLRTIVKCYNADDVLSKVQENFLVSHAREEEEKTLDEKFFKEEEVRIQLEFEKDMADLMDKQSKHLSTIKEEEKKIDEPKIQPSRPTTNLDVEEPMNNSTELYTKRNRCKKNKNIK